MNVTVRYGDDKITLELPDGAVLYEVSCKAMTGTFDRKTFLAELKSAERDIFPVSQADLFIVNDAYRPTPTETIFEWIDNGGGISDTAAVLIATGTHREPAEPQLLKIFGSFYERFKTRIFSHDCRRKDLMSAIGNDSGGNPIYVNRRFVEASRVVVIGSVEPHYFAGFTGGRKAIFPGLTDLETTARNHNLAVNFEAAPMKLEGNPVEEDLQSYLPFIADKQILSIQVVMGQGNTIASVHCGGLKKSFEKAVAESSEIFSGHYDEPYDLLLAEVRPPLDANLYQLQKSLENCQGAVKDDGTVILFSRCREGIGNRAFFDLAEKWKRGEVHLDAGPSGFGMHKLARVENIAKRLKVYLHSDLEEGIPEKVFYKEALNPQEIIDESGKNDKLIIALVHDAGHTVLVNE